MLAGLFLAKFGKQGLKALGFQTFTEFYGVISLALGWKGTSIKNYRDEFAPKFPGGIQGWHKREMRATRAAVFDKYGAMELPEMARLIKSAVYKTPATDILMESVDDDGGSSFAKRLITGQAAEQYFLNRYKSMPDFENLNLQDTTKWGCGFDFRLYSASVEYGVEVKGIKEASGAIVMTEKEHRIAGKMADNYFLFVVKNMREEPQEAVYRNPLNGALNFKSTQTTVVRTQWAAQVA